VSKSTSFDLRPCSMAQAKDVVLKYHGYGSMPGSATYLFAVFEDESPVAVYSWQPPPPGAARSVCPEAPYGVLSLSRMAAVPKGQRTLKHVSKPLRWQMKNLIDRGRWPVLVTYSDEGQGHTGHVYKCSGWKKSMRAKRPFYVADDGSRTSSYKNGSRSVGASALSGHTFLQRWEHWACDRGDAAVHVFLNGWVRLEVPGKRWKSGNQAYTYKKALYWRDS